MRYGILTRFKDICRRLNKTLNTNRKQTVPIESRNRCRGISAHDARSDCLLQFRSSLISYLASANYILRALRLVAISRFEAKLTLCREFQGD